MGFRQRFSCSLPSNVIQIITLILVVVIFEKITSDTRRNESLSESLENLIGLMDEKHLTIRAEGQSQIQTEKDFQELDPIIAKQTPYTHDFGNCQSMLNSGEWKDQKMTYADHRACSRIKSCRSSAWAPHNCRWHKYSSTDAKQCLQNKKILILGDSRARQLYLAMKNRLENEGRVMDDLSFKNKTSIADWQLKTYLPNYHVNLRWVWQCDIYENFDNHRDLTHCAPHATGVASDWQNLANF